MPSGNIVVESPADGRIERIQCLGLIRARFAGLKHSTTNYLVRCVLPTERLLENDNYLGRSFDIYLGRW